MPIAEAGSGLFTSPIFVLLFSYLLFKERIGWRRALAVLMGTIGVLLILKPGQEGFSGFHLLPILSGASYALDQSSLIVIFSMKALWQFCFHFFSLLVFVERC